MLFHKKHYPTLLLRRTVQIHRSFHAQVIETYLLIGAIQVRGKELENMEVSSSNTFKQIGNRKLSTELKRQDSQRINIFK